MITFHKPIMLETYIESRTAKEIAHYQLAEIRETDRTLYYVTDDLVNEYIEEREDEGVKYQVPIKKIIEKGSVFIKTKNYWIKYNSTFTEGIELHSCIGNSDDIPLDIANFLKEYPNYGSRLYKHIVSVPDTIPDLELGDKFKIHPMILEPRYFNHDHFLSPCEHWKIGKIYALVGKEEVKGGTLYLFCEPKYKAYQDILKNRRAFIVQSLFIDFDNEIKKINQKLK